MISAELGDGLLEVVATTLMVEPATKTNYIFLVIWPF
jgi:hypothetical protein